MFLLDRFIRQPIITLSSVPSMPGPASRTYYSVPVSHRHLDGLNYPASFRSELSLAFSRAYLLQPHAIVLSHLECRPLAQYVDRNAYALADHYYTYPQSPATDMLATKEEVARCRRLFRQNQGPTQSERSHNNDNNW